MRRDLSLETQSSTLEMAAEMHPNG
jgi:hypothetical protein